MKERLAEFLISDMGFRTFAIEADWPEANDVNRYVQTGQGDPAAVLQGLKYWVWNTQEVLDFIQWIRQWNVNAPPGEQVTFAGFDMQFPGGPIDSVLSYLGRVDTAMRMVAVQQYACVTPYRDHGTTFASPTVAYTDLPADTRSAPPPGA